MLLQNLTALRPSATILRTIIYTMGHMLIAICCVILITGSELKNAIVDAFIEPMINGVWYFILDYFWTLHMSKRS